MIIVENIIQKEIEQNSEVIKCLWKELFITAHKLEHYGYCPLDYSKKFIPSEDSL